MTQDLPLYMEPCIDTNAPDNAAQVWAFTGSSGGVGVTSLCIQTALQLYEFGKDESVKVCLIDLDFEQGACAQYLDMEPILTTDDLSRDARSIDKNLVNSFLQRFEQSFDIFVAQNVLNGNALVNPETVITVLDILSQTYDYVILDMPRLWTPWTHAAFGAADKVNFVAELSVPSLKTSKRLMDSVAKKLGLSTEFDLIINKHERRAFRNALTLKDAENVIGKPIAGTVPLQFEIVRKAINKGLPVGLDASDSRYVKDIKAMILEWQDELKPQLQAAS